MPIFALRSGLRICCLLLVGSGLFAACAESKTAQCQKTIGVIRQVAQESEASRQSVETDKVLAMADNFDKAAKTMQDLKLADPRLAEFQAAYVGVYRSNAEVTRNFIAALLKKDIVTARLHLKRVQEVGDREQSLRAELNSYCQPQ